MKRKLLALVLLFLVFAGAAAWLAWPASTQITMENASRIKKGMTQAEVEAILGGAERDELLAIGGYATVFPFGHTIAEGREVRRGLWRTMWKWPSVNLFLSFRGKGWTSAECNVEVFFDASQRVLRADVAPVAEVTEFGLFFLKN